MEQRLIDANPIFDKVEANYRISEGVQHVCEREFLNLICDAPTIDAVPVSYIYKRAMELKNDDMIYAYRVLIGLIANYRAECK